MSKKRRNPVAHAPILRKGGVHQKSRSAERQKQKRKLRQSISAYAATLCGRDGFIQHTLMYISHWSTILKKRPNLFFLVQ